MSPFATVVSVVMTKTQDSYIHDVYDFFSWTYAATSFAKSDFSSVIQKVLYLFYRCIMTTMYLSQIVLFAIDFTETYKDPALFSVGMSFLIIGLVGLLKIFLMSVNWEVVHDIESRLDNNFNMPWIGNQEWVLDVKRKNKRFLTITGKYICTVFFFCALSLFILPFVPGSPMNFVIPFPYKEISKTSYSTLIFVYHLFMLINFFFSYISNEMFYLGLVLRLCNNLEILEKNLQRRRLPSVDWPVGQKSLLNYKSKHLLFFEDATARKKTLARMLDEKRTRLIKNSIIHLQAVMR